MKCMDCKISTWTEHYMVHDWLWKKVSPNVLGLLCIGCLECRLGRELTKADFTDAPINSQRIFEKSRKLQGRLGLQTPDDLTALRLLTKFNNHLTP